MPQLTWLGDDAARHAHRRVPFKLIETVETVGDPASGNLLLQGDNLEALKSLLPLYAGRVKCIFIDPPYNTKSAFEHYDDNLEHSQWLSMMRPRLTLLRELLAEDGSIWVTIDDNEAHYLKVLMDEVFGRGNFVANVVWQKKYAVANDHKTIAPMHDHGLVYRKSPLWRRNLVPRTAEKDRQYRYEDERGVFRVSDYTCNKSSDERPNLYYPILNPQGVEVWPKKTAVWRYSQERHQQNVSQGLVYWGRDGTSRVPAFKRYRKDLINDGIIPQTLWLHDYASHTDAARKEVRAVMDSQGLADDFLTPKPEGLLVRVLEIASNPNDLILDSFLGSGTTAAVAHKMGRRWIGIEMGEHARTHCLPRLRKVVEGEQGGVSQAVGWAGGGGFRFARLGDSVFEADGRIHPGVRFPALAGWLWFAETRTPAPDAGFGSPLLGIDGDTAIVLLYNGILGDRRPQGGNVLTHAVWTHLQSLAPGHAGRWRIFGEANRLGPATCKRLGIEFRQIPYDLGAR